MCHVLYGKKSSMQRSNHHEDDRGTPILIPASSSDLILSGNFRRTTYSTQRNCSLMNMNLVSAECDKANLGIENQALHPAFA